MSDEINNHELSDEDVLELLESSYELTTARDIFVKHLTHINIIQEYGAYGTRLKLAEYNAVVQIVKAFGFKINVQGREKISDGP